MRRGCGMRVPQSRVRVLKYKKALTQTMHTHSLGHSTALQTHAFSLWLCSKEHDKHKQEKDEKKYELKQHTFQRLRWAQNVPSHRCHCVCCLQTNTQTHSLLSCVAPHAMKSTWLKFGVVHDLLSDKSIPQRELIGETVPPSLSAVMRSPSHLLHRVSWFKDHKMLAASINQLLSLRKVALMEEEVQKTF